MENNRRNQDNPLIKKFNAKIKKTGFDNNFVQAAHFHLGILNSFDDEIKDRDDLCNLLMAKLFLDKIDMYPEKRFSCKVDENSDWPVPLLPVELFQSLPESYRTACFQEFLIVGDILDCRVSSVSSSDYLLRVIHKYGCTRILDDLNLMVKLPKNKSDIQILEKKELLTCELIRVMVSEISKTDKEITITVTLNKSGSTEVKLGRIPEEYLPFYVFDPPDTDKYSSYANYLSSMPQFGKNFPLLKDFFVDFGFEPRIYSFDPAFDGLICAKENTGQALLKKSKVNDAKNYAQYALEAVKEKEDSRALSFINMALEICPKDEPLKTTLYQIKGDIYKSNVKPALVNYIIAYFMDPGSEKVKQQLAKYFFKTANGYYRTKRYRKAVIYAEMSCILNSRNYEATSLLEYLKKKHPEDVTNTLEEESLFELHKKKKKLVSKLKKSGETGKTRKSRGNRKFGSKVREK